jgi:hypothetical protein
MRYKYKPDLSGELQQALEPVSDSLFRLSEFTLVMLGVQSLKRVRAILLLEVVFNLTKLFAEFAVENLIVENFLEVRP